uniref:Putative lysosomal acid phosphatase n=1 Tax=Rhipicephalus microplus TaxID=6941 RepID=A0A6M2D445_RHIMP
MKLACLLVFAAGAAARSIQQCGEASTLRQLHVMFRHGDRTPTSLYPNDPNSPSDFPEGLGHITHKGKNDQYNLGKYLRTKYEDFLTYDSNEMRARSSARERCLESIQTNLYGLYPPRDKKVWNSEVDWQPVPIQTMPVDLDGMLYEDAICPADDEELERIRESPEGAEGMSNNADFMRTLEQLSGKKMTDWVSVRDLLDTLTIERSRNLKIPDWALPLWGNMTRVAKYTTILNYNSALHNRLRAGLMIREILRHSDEVINGKSNVKLYMYAAHDVLIAAFTSAFGVFNQLAVPSSTAVITELHEDADGNFYIQMLFKNDTTRKPYRLEIPGCEGFRCNLKTFKAIAKPYVVEDWRQECGLEALPGGTNLFP